MEKGIFLHFGDNTIVKVCDTKEEFEEFVDGLKDMRSEITEKW